MKTGTNITGRLLQIGWALLVGLVCLTAVPLRAQEGKATPQTSGEFLARGHQFFRAKNWDKAITDYDESLKLRDNATAYLMRAAAQINKKNYEAALADLNKAQQLDGSEFLVYFRRAQVYELQGKKELAEAEKKAGAQRFLQNAKPATAKAFSERAAYFYERGFYADAINDYGEAIKLDANYAEAYEKRGDVYDLNGKTDLAIADYNRLIELQPQRAQSYVRRAQFLEVAEILNDKDYSKELLRDYTEIINRKAAFEAEVQPLRRAYLSRAVLYEDSKDFDKAIADYTDALKLDPTDARAFLDRGQAWAATKSYDSALRDFDYALVLSPKSPTVYNERGRAYKALNLTEKALADFSRAIEIDARYFWPLVNRADLYLSKGDNDKAIEDYTKAIALNNKDDGSFNNRGVAYINKKEWDKALADFDEALKINSKNPNSLNNRGVAFNAKGELDNAVAAYTQAIAADASYAKAYANRAAVYRKQNKNDLAEADEKKAKELEGKTPAPAIAAPLLFDDEDDF